MKIVFFETMPGERESLVPLLPTGHDIQFHAEALSVDTIAKAADADAISVFVKSPLTASLLDRLPSLKLITTRSMGFDHIDLTHAKKNGIAVNNVQTYASHPVAEFAFALLLAVARKIYPAYNQMREGTNLSQEGLLGVTLYGKTLGVAGMGRIGKNVATIGKGLGMKILAYDTFPDPAFSAEHHIPYVSLDHLVAESDVLSLHLPSTPETRHLINASSFAQMKKGVILINTARGDIVDTQALVAALRDGTVWGAGLDVLEEEQTLREEISAIADDKPNMNYELLAANHILIDMPNVVVTPHIAFETVEAMQEIARVTAETISNFAAGKEQKYL